MNILLTSAGRRTYLVQYFKDALHPDGKVFASNSLYTSALACADEFVISPLIYAPDYIDFLLDYAKEKKISAIIPLFDIDAAVLARNADRFSAEGIAVVTGPAESLTVCNDKWEMFRFLSRNGVPTPKTFLDVEDCLAAIRGGSISFPVIVKPRWGMGSIGIYSAENEDELRIFDLKVRRDILKTYLKYESEQDVEHCVIMQEKMNGAEFGLDVINDLQGGYVVTSVKRKLAMRAGETDIAVTTDVPVLSELGKKLSGLMRHAGNLDVDCFMVGDRPYVLEMNCRFGGQFPFSYLAGVDLPRQIVKWLNHEGTDLSLLTPSREVLSVKDLAPVKCDYRENETHEGITYSVDHATAEELESFYRISDHYFTPLLSSRVDIHEMALKNRKNGFSMEARVNGELIGLVLGYANDHVSDRAYLPFVIVREDFRRRGIADRLIQKACSYALFHGMKSISLETDITNKGALNLYLKCGFHEVSRNAVKIHLQMDLR